MSDLPKISIITPSYNQGQFLERAIISVISQNYPNLEYIVLDGGSKDNSCEIIKKYTGYIDYWHSQTDGGQSDAIAEGFEIASGTILSWINSDDMLLPGTLLYVGQQFAKHKDKLKWLIGGTVIIDEHDRIIEYRKAFPVNFNVMISTGMGFCQQSCFWRKSIYEQVGGLDKKRQFCMDYDLFLKFANVSKPKWIGKPLGVFRLHSEAKTTRMLAVKNEEDELIRQQWKANIPKLRRKLYYLCRAFWTKTTTNSPKSKKVIKLSQNYNLMR